MKAAGEETADCCGVIIAAGLSSRMGDFKPLLPIGGKPAIHHLIEHFQSAGVGSLVIVTGYRADELMASCFGFSGLTFVHNRDFRTTDMIDSARIGFRSIPDNCSRVLYTPADICLISEPLIRELANAEDALVFPSFHYRKGHPVSIVGSLVPKLISYKGPGGLKGAFASLDAAPSYLITEDAATLMDMDTPEDYRKMCEYAALTVKHT